MGNQKLGIRTTFLGIPNILPCQISIEAALYICAWGQLSLIPVPITEGSWTSCHVSWPAVLPLLPSQRLPSHHLWFWQNTLGSRRHWCDSPSLCHLQILLAPTKHILGKRFNFDIYTDKIYKHVFNKNWPVSFWQAPVWCAHHCADLFYYPQGWWEHLGRSVSLQASTFQECSLP